MILSKDDKDALALWEELLDSTRKSTTVNKNETVEEKKKKLAHLEKEGNEEEWFQEFFPQYCFAKPAAFHRKSTKKFLSAKRCLHRRAWARGLSKSTRRMMEILYKKLVQKKNIIALMISKSEENAIRLLGPYRANLEANQRIIHYYGPQKKEGGGWHDYSFITRDKSMFIAVGTGQNPRGAKLEELRVNTVIFDDADDDEVCQNEDRLNKVWSWCKKSVMPCIEISKEYWICWDNNVIAEDSLSIRAQAIATIDETVNIRDENGVSVWPEKNSEADIDEFFAMLEEDDIQTEYYNNPMSQGASFSEMKYGKCLKITDYQYVVVYADPSTSNNDKPKGKSKAKNSQKAVVVVGYKDLTYYLHKVYVDVTTNEIFINWIYQAEILTRNVKHRQFWIENNGFQSPFYEQVLWPLIVKRAKEPGTPGVVPLQLDDRDKPDKFFRIDGTVKPLNDRGLLILNEAEKEDKHMKRLEKQFKAVKPNSKTMDGPDATEGAIYKIQMLLAVLNVGSITIIKRRPNKKGY